VRRAAAILAVAVATAAAGCGSGGPDETGPVKSTVRAYVDAFVRGDGPGMCALMTPDTRVKFVKAVRALAKTDDCAKATVAVRNAAGPKAIAAMRGAQIRNVRIDGSNASVKLVASSGQSLATLRKERGKWRVSLTLAAP
jgi:hypothetical protein